MFKLLSHSAAADDDVQNNLSSSVLLVDDVAEIVKQIMSNFGTPSFSALSVTSGSDLDGISILKQDLNYHFEMKDLGTLSYFLRLEVSTASDRYYLSQAKYASDLLSRAGLTDSKTTSTLLEPNVRFTLLDGTPLRDPTLYRTLVGNLVCLTVTRPDIAYVVYLIVKMQTAKNAAASVKETAANVAASAKAGMEKTKATAQEKGEKMTAHDPMQKEMATEKKETRVNQAELNKQGERQENAAARQAASATGGTHSYSTTGATGQPTGMHQRSALPGHGTGQPAGQVVEGVVPSHPVGTDTGTARPTPAHNTRVGGGTNTGYGTGGAFTG
ncbi:hypothetical protein RJ639_021382 [Escallonia herrerae]|uniref:Reverse transcriptase Ty1/copia-type domain-containing protein n=1 Tax=Escallonia herrerae TaxID=1293975 RepID=A0AA88V2C2_9ASTE|nr:hypothetical protein RJ639_021382 [Escallonia herrerae]